MNIVGIRLIILVSIVSLMVSCFCKETDTPYVSMQDIQFENYHVINGFFGGNQEIGSSDFRLNLRINCDFVAMNSVSLPLIDRAYATSCDPGEGTKGLKHDIVKLELTCDDMISGIEAGKNLASSDIMTVYYLRHKDKVEMSVTDWIKGINENKSLGDNSSFNMPFRNLQQEYFFLFKDDVTTNDFVRFKIYIELDNGQSLEHETARVKII